MNDEALEFYRARVNSLAAESVKADRRTTYLTRQVRQMRLGFELLTEIHRTTAGLRKDRDVLLHTATCIQMRLAMDLVIVLTAGAGGQREYTPSITLAASGAVAVPLLPVAPDPQWMMARRPAVAGATAEGVAPDRDPAFVGHLREQLALASMMALPLVVEGAPVGLLVAGRVPRHARMLEMPLEEADVTTFEAIGSMVAATLSNLLREREKEAIELQITGGFAHEMRNSLSAARLVLARATGEDSGSLCEQNVGALRGLFGSIEGQLDDALRRQAATVVREISRTERTLHETLGEASLAVNRALLITSEILGYARAGAGVNGGREVDLGEMVRGVLGPLEPSLRAADVVVETALEAGVTRFAEEGHIHSIISNLVLNARDALVALAPGDAVERGGRVLKIRIERTADHDLLVVEDNGVGIPEANRERIFEPFFTTKPETGTGLGLGLVKKLATSYDASIEVQTEPDRGTVMRVRFPPTGLPKAR